MNFNSAAMWDKHATSKQMMAFAKQKEADMQASAQKSIENREARAEKLSERRRESLDMVRALEQLVVNAGGQWVIGTRAGEIKKGHITAVYCAFDKPHPDGTWRDWLPSVQLIVCWDPAADKFTKLCAWNGR